MMKLPLVSVMIPTYNQESYISEAIESVIKQDYPMLEIIVSDDNSIDNTSTVIQKYLNDPRITYNKNEINLGRVGNYHHTAHNIANGKWAVNLDGDDYYKSTSFITDAIETINSLNNDNIVAYCYRHINLNKIKKIIPYKEIDNHRIIVSGKDYFLNYYKIGQFGHLNTMYRRDLGLKLGLYTLPYQACDFHSLIRLFLLGNLILDDRIIAHWRVHENNTTILEVEQKQTQAMLTFDAIQEFAKHYFSSKELINWRKNMNKMAFCDYINTYLRVNRNWKAFKLLVLNPRCTRSYLRNWYHFIFNK